MFGKKVKSRRKTRIRQTLRKVGRRLLFEELEARLVLSAPEYEYASPALATSNVTSYLSSISRDGKTVMLTTNATTTSTGEPLPGADGTLGIWKRVFTSPRVVPETPEAAPFTRIDANLTSSFLIQGSGIDGLRNVTLTGSAVMSPNGDYVAFNVPYELVGAIMTIDTRIAQQAGVNSNGDPIYDNPSTGEHYGTNPPLVLGFEQYIHGSGYIAFRAGSPVQLPGSTDYGEPISIANDGRALFGQTDVILATLPGSGLLCFAGGDAKLAVTEHTATADVPIAYFPVGSGARLSGDGKFAFYVSSSGQLVRQSVGGPSNTIVVSPHVTSGANFSASYDGRFVAFYTSEPLISDDTDNVDDVYSADLGVGGDFVAAPAGYKSGFGGNFYALASRSAAVVGAAFENASVSDDGRFVAFTSTYHSFHPEVPFNGQSTVFLEDVASGENSESFYSPKDVNQLQISGDGRYIAFGIGSYAGGPFLEDVLRWRNPFLFVPNAPPVVVHPLDNVFLTEGVPWTSQLPADIFSDIDQPTSPTVHYSLSSTLPAWLSYDESTHVLSGTPTKVGQDEIVTIAFTATDEGTDFDPEPLSTTTYLTVHIQPINHQPTIGQSPLASVFVMANSDFTYLVDAGANFTDYDFIYGDRLTFTATLADGQPLPSWLNFLDLQASLPQNDHLAIYGRPPFTGDTYGLNIRVTATDIVGLFVTGDFNLIVTVPTTLPAPAIVYVDPSWSGPLYTPFDPDGDGPIATAYFGYTAFNSIQAAIDTVAPNGNIIVHSGTYNPGSNGQQGGGGGPEGGGNGADLNDLPIISNNNKSVTISLIDPTFTPVHVTINNAVLKLDSRARLNMRLFSSAAPGLPSSSDTIIVNNGAISLMGGATGPRLTLGGNYAPVFGDSFDLISVQNPASPPGFSGQFRNLGDDGIFLFNGFAPLHVTYTNTALNFEYRLQDRLNSAFQGDTIQVDSLAQGPVKVPPGVTLSLGMQGTINGNVTLSQSSSLVNDGIIIGTVINDHGKITGNGKIAGNLFDLGGIVAPGHSPGQMTITGDFTSTGTVVLEINGAVAGTSYDQIVVGGTADLSAATLDAVVNYVPSADEVIELIRGGQRVLPFANYSNGESVNGDLKTYYTTTQANLVVQPANQPNVSGVKLGSSGWSQAFLDFVDTTSAAGNGHGYIAALGASQPVDLPWTNVDRLSVTFDRDVQNIDGTPLKVSNFALIGVNNLDYSQLVSGFSYDSLTRTATFSFSQPLTADRVLIFIPAGTIADLSGNILNSDYRVQFSILPGDVSRDGIVLGTDTGQARLNLATGIGLPPNTTANGVFTYSIYRDLNGDGATSAIDIDLARSQQFSTLPNGVPIPMAPATGQSVLRRVDQASAAGVRGNLPVGVAIAPAIAMVETTVRAPRQFIAAEAFANFESDTLHAVSLLNVGLSSFEATAAKTWEVDGDDLTVNYDKAITGLWGADASSCHETTLLAELANQISSTLRSAMSQA